MGYHEPIKQHSYRVNPLKRAHLNKEIEYMLENNILEPSKSEWSSLCVLVPKPDGSDRFVTDFRKVNQCSKTDSYPIPRIDDHPPTLEETLATIRQMKTNKAAGLDCAITAEALQDDGDAMADVINCFCAEVGSNLTPPDQ